MILHADLDAFYASVAQRDDPALRGKAIAVSGASRRAVVLTASYEARPFGVRSAMPLYQALERCPHLIVVPPRFEAYRDASHRVFAILRAHARAVEGLSLDEAYLDVGDIPLERAVEIARRIKDEVRQAVRLTISIGVASSKLVAKIASDEGKPDGLVAVNPGEEAAFIAPKPVGSLWGVGPKTQARLREAGIERIEHVAALSDDRVGELFGKWGSTLRELARGVDERRVEEDETVRSISSEATFEFDVHRLTDLVPAIREQARDVAARLAKRGLRALTVGVKIKFADFSKVGRQTTLAQPTNDERVISAAAVFCLRRAFAGTKPARLVGVRASTLIRDQTKQIALF
ncbi:MAG TPA: DNA polymerase IV [Candidatus Eremiobacteraceae bacterium]|nr:DNA polymerase IV [Candidatus Eremiobacteraceae bacterium]